MTPEPQTTTQRPVSVDVAVKLLWTSLAVAVPKILLDYTHLRALENVLLTGFSLVAMFALMAWLILRIAQGKNWARIAYFVPFLLGIFPTLPTIMTVFARSSLVGILTLAQVGLQLYALFLLFSGAGGAWFRKLNAA